MKPVDLFRTASALPQAWSSRALGDVGTARVKVLRMDGTGVAEEVHDVAEVLLVLDGRLELTVEGADLSVRPGELCVVPAGARHTVREGSLGTLVIVESTAA
ncbi:cupin domain-containing protein [Kitasatospora sp. NPDC058201]|uniref:cupin domain-containing protein n=1 Tax=unclassified Kitasatospora TaxID=2633591 RepID=UPI00366A1822